MIRFLRAQYSTNCERVALALALKGVEADSVWITYDRGEVERDGVERERLAGWIDRLDALPRL